jgi:predicted RNA-binding Zn-ribbon protein involved in translation (DUF1610 family)
MRVCRSCGQILELKNKDTYFKCGNGSKRGVYYCNRCFDLTEEQRKVMYLRRVSK